MRFHRGPIGFHSNPANLSDSPNPWIRHEPCLRLPKHPVGFVKTRGCIPKRRGWICPNLRLDFPSPQVGFCRDFNLIRRTDKRGRTGAFASATLRNEMPLPYGTRCRSPTERHAVPTERGAVPYGTTFRTLRNEVPCNTEEKPEDNPVEEPTE